MHLCLLFSLLLRRVFVVNAADAFLDRYLVRTLVQSTPVGVDGGGRGGVNGRGEGGYDPDAAADDDEIGAYLSASAMSHDVHPHRLSPCALAFSGAMAMRRLPAHLHEFRVHGDTSKLPPPPPPPPPPSPPLSYLPPRLSSFLISESSSLPPPPPPPPLPARILLLRAGWQSRAVLATVLQTWVVQTCSRVTNPFNVFQTFHYSTSDKIAIHRNLGETALRHVTETGMESDAGGGGGGDENSDDAATTMLEAITDSLRAFLANSADAGDCDAAVMTKGSYDAAAATEARVKRQLVLVLHHMHAIDCYGFLFRNVKTSYYPFRVVTFFLTSAVIAFTSAIDVSTATRVFIPGILFLFSATFVLLRFPFLAAWRNRMNLTVIVAALVNCDLVLGFLVFINEGGDDDGSVAMFATLTILTVLALAALLCMYLFYHTDVVRQCVGTVRSVAASGTAACCGGGERRVAEQGEHANGDGSGNGKNRKGGYAVADVGLFAIPADAGEIYDNSSLSSSTPSRDLLPSPSASSSSLTGSLRAAHSRSRAANRRDVNAPGNASGGIGGRGDDSDDGVDESVIIAVHGGGGTASPSSLSSSSSSSLLTAQSSRSNDWRPLTVSRASVFNSAQPLMYSKNEKQAFARTQARASVVADAAVVAASAAAGGAKAAAFAPGAMQSIELAEHFLDGRKSKLFAKANREADVMRALRAAEKSEAKATKTAAMAAAAAAAAAASIDALGTASSSFTFSDYVSDVTSDGDDSTGASDGDWSRVNVGVDGDEGGGDGGGHDIADMLNSFLDTVGGDSDDDEHDGGSGDGFTDTLGLLKGVDFATATDDDGDDDDNGDDALDDSRRRRRPHSHRTAVNSGGGGHRIAVNSDGDVRAARRALSPSLPPSPTAAPTLGSFDGDGDYAGTHAGGGTGASLDLDDSYNAPRVARNRLLFSNDILALFDVRGQLNVDE
jgi:hypothetical protein